VCLKLESWKAFSLGFRRSHSAPQANPLFQKKFWFEASTPFDVESINKTSASGSVMNSRKEVEVYEMSDYSSLMSKSSYLN